MTDVRVAASSVAVRDTSRETAHREEAEAVATAMTHVGLDAVAAETDAEAHLVVDIIVVHIVAVIAVLALLTAVTEDEVAFVIADTTREASASVHTDQEAPDHRGTSTRTSHEAAHQDTARSRQDRRVQDPLILTSEMLVTIPQSPGKVLTSSAMETTLTVRTKEMFLTLRRKTSTRTLSEKPN